MQTPRKTRVSLIAAVAANGIIGHHNAMPWRLPEDLKHFKALTLGHPVIMGRKTYESLGRPLPGRRNIVISRQRCFDSDTCVTARSLDDALQGCQMDSNEVFVIGGAQIYAEALPVAERLYLTEIHRDYPGDTHFPAVDWSSWRETRRQQHQNSEGLEYDFVTYERIQPPPGC